MKLQGCFLAVVALVIILLVSIATYLQYANNDNTMIRQKGETKLNKTGEKKTVLLLYWSTVFGRKVKVNNAILFPRFIVNDDCDVHCELTVDRGREKEADGIIIHARDLKPLPAWSEFNHTRFILHTRENPIYTPVLRDQLFLSHFNYSMTYRLDSHFPTPGVGKPSLALPVPFKEKRNMVLAAFSNCEPVRTAYLAKLMKLIDIDSYGACLNNKRDDLPKRYQKGFKEKKAELARSYKFTLVFMNADCDYFVDDQLSHALNAGSVPVFMGTDKVDEFLHGNLRSSIIKVKDFKSPEDLAKYLKFVSSNESEYNKYLTWKYQGFQFPASYYTSAIGKFWESRDTDYCKLCKRLSQRSEESSGALKPDMCKSRDITRYISKNGN